MTYQEPEQNYTKIPNPILDVMGEMSESELKLTMCLVRYTFGYHTDRAQMTYELMQERTGMSRGGVYRAIELVEERGFFRRGRKSFWFINSSLFELCYVNNTGKSSDTELQKSTNSSESERKYAGKSSKSEPNKRKEIKEKEINTYMPAFDLNEQFKTALAQVAKETLTPGFNEKKYEDAAFALIGWDADLSQVAGFTDYWKQNGWHNGKPALTNIVNHWQDYLQGRDLKSKNGRTVSNPARPQPAPASERTGGFY